LPNVFRNKNEEEKKEKKEREKNDKKNVTLYGEGDKI
jgi:hypothetical protein